MMANDDAAACNKLIDTEKMTVEELNVAGKEAMAEKNFEKAIECYGSALQKAVLTVGNGQEDHPDLAPFYARYGKALLEGAFGAEPYSMLLRPEVAKNLNVAAEVGESDGKTILLSDDEEEEDDVEEEGDGTNDDNQEDGEPEEETAAEETAETDFDLAFAMLDTARVLYAAQEGQEARMHESLVLEDIGDLSMEMEEFEAAVKDYEEAIGAMQKAPSFLRDARALASLKFKLACALEYSERVPEAVEALREAQTLLNILLTEDNADSKGKGKELHSMTDLQAIIKEVSDKYEELRSGKSIQTNGGNLQEAMKEAAAKVVATSSVNDLSGMVKRRRVE